MERRVKIARRPVFAGRRRVKREKALNGAPKTVNQISRREQWSVREAEGGGGVEY